MVLCLFNSLSSEIEEFRPLQEGKVGMYTCGPTVHDRAHIGNLRTFLAEDLLRRQLEAQGLAVTQVMNITDVDDKIIAKASAAGLSLEEFTRPFIGAFMADLEALGVEPAASMPRATQCVGEMIELVQRLLDGGHAYQSDGSVYFRIASFPAYGRLSHLDLAGLRAGASGRIDSDEYAAKEKVGDFVLWKGEPEGSLAVWEAAFGRGRPGWHLECSAMALSLLGDSFDIHCGGVDNKFPHHENEIAQSEAATGKPFARYWFHPEHLVVAGGKMAKSEGNFVTLASLQERGHDPLVVRYLLLTGAHYRHRLQFQEEMLEAAEKDLDRLVGFWRRCQEVAQSGVAATRQLAGSGPGSGREPGDYEQDFEAALDDDLNLPDAMAAIFDLCRDGNRRLDTGSAGAAEAKEFLAVLRSADSRLGVIEKTATAADRLSEQESQLLEEREQARKGGDYGRADLLRAQLLELGIQVEDTGAGPRWHRL